MCFISVSVCVFCNRVLDLKFQSIYSTKGKWRIGGLTSEIAMFLCTTYGRSGRCKAPSRLWEIFMLTAQWFHPLQFPWAGVENTSSKANEMYWSIYLSSICHLSYIHCLNSCVAVEWSGVCVVYRWECFLFCRLQRAFRWLNSSTDICSSVSACPRWPPNGRTTSAMRVKSMPTTSTSGSSGRSSAEK